MNVFAEMTDREQPSNVFDFVEHREVDGIRGELSPLCAALRITEATLLLSAQIVRNAMHAGADETQAYAAGIRYAKAHQEPTPELEKSFSEFDRARQQKRLSDATRQPSVAEVDESFRGCPQPPPRSAA
jgi:hypothetical protein